MKRLHNLGLGLLAATSVALMSQSAHAQAAEDPDCDGHHSGEHWRMHHDPSAFVEKRLTTLKEKLQIKPDQEAAWKALEDKIKQHFEAMKSLRESMREAPKTVPERLDRAV